jgi:hypothetical protein
MRRAHRETIVAVVVRAILWVLLIVAPGGVFLLPLLLGDAVARRKREEAGKRAERTDGVSKVTHTVDPQLAAPASGH